MKIEYKSDKAKGFTLLEVMIALVILAIAMTTLIISSGGITRNNLRLEDKTVASWIAVNVITKARLGLIKPTAGEKALQGKEEMLQHQWQWELSRYSTPDKNTSKIIVSVGPLNQESVISMTGYLKN